MGRCHFGRCATNSWVSAGWPSEPPRIPPAALIRQQRRARWGWRPGPVQCIPDAESLSNDRLQPASMTPDPTNNLVCGNRHSASVGGWLSIDGCRSDPLRPSWDAVSAKRALAFRRYRHQVLLCAGQPLFHRRLPTRIRFCEIGLSVPGVIQVDDLYAPGKCSSAIPRSTCSVASTMTFTARPDSAYGPA